MFVGLVTSRHAISFNGQTYLGHSAGFDAPFLTFMTWQLANAERAETVASGIEAMKDCKHPVSRGFGPAHLYWLHMSTCVIGSFLAGCLFRNVRTFFPALDHR